MSFKNTYDFKYLSTTHNVNNYENILPETQRKAQLKLVSLPPHYIHKWNQILDLQWGQQ